MTRQTKAENLADLVRNLGGEPAGTISDLIEQLEWLAAAGAIAPARVDEAIEAYLEDPRNYAMLTEEDFGEIFRV